jgi:hypothetical protein
MSVYCLLHLFQCEVGIRGEDIWISDLIIVSSEVLWSLGPQYTIPPLTCMFPLFQAPFGYSLLLGGCFSLTPLWWDEKHRQAALNKDTCCCNFSDGAVAGHKGSYFLSQRGKLCLLLFLLFSLPLSNPCTRCTMWECHMVISGLLVESLCRELGTGVPGHRVVCQVYRVLGGSAGRARQTWFCDLGETMVQLASASPWAEHFLSFYNSSLFFLHFKKSIHDNYMYLWGTM